MANIGISVALVEMFVGVIAGHVLGIQTTPCIDFLATCGSGVLTFLTGAQGAGGLDDCLHAVASAIEEIGRRHAA